MNYNLKCELNHKLSINSYLQQTTKLLQLSTIELQQEIQMIIEKNPLLENEEIDIFYDNMIDKKLIKNFSHDIRFNKFDKNECSFSSLNCINTTNNIICNKQTTQSLQDYLIWQATLTPFTDIDRVIAFFIIDAVNNMGYLTSSLEEIKEGIGDKKLTIKEIEIVLKRIQHFDPIGVGSRSLKEYLLIQLKQFDPSTPNLLDTKLIISNHINLLANHDFRNLMRITKLKKNILKKIILMIKSLNPYPGKLIDVYEPKYIIPDIFVNKINKKWIVELNKNNIPHLKINKYYASMKKITGNDIDNKFIYDNLKEAKLIIKILENRNNALLNVTQCIVDQQKEFFEHGEKYIKPMVLQDISKIVNLHESTISRITTQKYLYSSQGIFELKYFFSNSITIRGGGQISSKIVRKLVKNLILKENCIKPLSDNNLASLLSKKGIIIARRTITKYREDLDIPSSYYRKKLI